MYSREDVKDIKHDIFSARDRLEDLADELSDAEGYGYIVEKLDKAISELSDSYGHIRSAEKDMRDYGLFDN